MARYGGERTVRSGKTVCSNRTFTLDASHTPIAVVKRVFDGKALVSDIRQHTFGGVLSNTKRRMQSP